MFNVESREVMDVCGHEKNWRFTYHARANGSQVQGWKEFVEYIAKEEEKRRMANEGWHLHRLRGKSQSDGCRIKEAT